MMVRPTKFTALMAMSIITVGAQRLGEMSLEENLNPLYPRFMFGSAPRLAKRQAGTDCGPGEHSCELPIMLVIIQRSLADC